MLAAQDSKGSVALQQMIGNCCGHCFLVKLSFALLLSRCLALILSLSLPLAHSLSLVSLSHSLSPVLCLSLSLSLSARLSILSASVRNTVNKCCYVRRTHIHTYCTVRNTVNTCCHVSGATKVCVRHVIVALIIDCYRFVLFAARAEGGGWGGEAMIVLSFLLFMDAEIIDMAIPGTIQQSK